MNYAVIKKNDIANGTGVRVSLFVSGCSHRCAGCFNSEAWDYDYGQPFTQSIIDEILSACAPDYVRGLSLLGGEPLDPLNQEGVCNLLRQFKEAYPTKDVWCYTGYIYDPDLMIGGRAYGIHTYEILSSVDVLVDGPFVDKLRSLKLKFRGSSNQRIIDMPSTLKQNRVILLDENKY